MKKCDINFQGIVEAANDIIIVTKSQPLDPPGPEIVYVNKAFTELTEYTFEEAVGQNPRILQASGTDSETKQAIRTRLERQESARVTIKNYSKSGKAYWLDLSILPLRDTDGAVTHFVAVERDVTQQKELEEKLDKLSRTDPLTGLLNRRSFEEISANEFSRFKRQGEKYSLLMLDVDHFKSINDQYGHRTGDLALTSLSGVLTQNLRMHDAVARLGGDEFCAILPYTGSGAALNIAEKLRVGISNLCLESGGSTLSVATSIGVSEVLASDSQHTQVLERADKALYKAKKAGRNKVHAFVH